MLDDSPPGIQCRTLCGASPGTTKRGWTGLENRSSLVKRIFDPWPPLPGPKQTLDQAKDEWMVNACGALTPNELLIPAWAEGDPGYASAVTAPFGDTAFKFGTPGICGCTMVFVVSRKRVYLGNYGQTPREASSSFAKC